MKKIVVLLLLLIVTAITARSQSINFDSLKHAAAKQTQHDTAWYATICKLMDTYAEYRPDSSIFYANQKYAWAKSHNNAVDMADAKGAISYALYNKGNYVGALDMGLQCLRGILPTKNLPNIANTYNLLGNIYKGQQNYTKALYYYRLCRQTAAAGKDTVDTFYADYNMAYIFEHTNVLDSAIYYLKPIYNLHDHRCFILYLRGNICFKLKDYKNALYYYHQSYVLAQKAKDFKSGSFTAISLAHYFDRLGNADSAIYYARRALVFAKSVSFNVNVYESTGLMAGFYEARRQPDSAYKYLKQSSAIRDSLYSATKLQAADVLTASEEQHNREIAEAEATYKNNLQLYILGFVLIVFLVAGILLWRNNRVKQKAFIVLQDQKRETDIQKAATEDALNNLKSTQNQLIQSEKMASLGELTAGIAHEIQNPLNFVNNFSEVSVELVDEMQNGLNNGDKNEAIAISEDIKQNLEKIRHHGKRADFIVKGMLQHSRTSTGEKQLTDINILADEFLKLSYHGLRAKDKSFNAELVTNFDKNLPKVNIAQQDIGRVLLNLFNNAFYAVNQKKKTAGDDYKPEVVISTSMDKGNLVISVKDNGNGIPDAIKDKIMQPFFTTKPTGEGTGLGLSLSYDIVVKGHGGKIEVESEEGKFTIFTVTLPAG